MIANSLAKNTTFFTIALAMQKALSFVYFIFVARFIGVENMGKFSFALSFTTIFAMFMDFGLSQVLIRESARDSQKSQEHLAATLGLKLIGAVIVYALVVLLINVLDYPLLTRQMVYVAGLVMIIDSFSLSFFSILRGRQNLKYESYGVVINQMIVLFFGLAVMILHWGLVALISVYLLGSLFNFFLSFFTLKRKLNLRPQISLAWPAIKAILKLALPFGIAGLFLRLYSSMDVVFLSKLANDEAVGLYSTAYRITFALQFVAVAFAASIYPAFCFYFKNSLEQLVKSFKKSIRYLLIISLPITFGVLTIGQEVIGLVFGRAYVACAPALNVLIAVLPVIFLTFPVGAILNACNRQTRNTIHLGVVALTNIVLNLILIPRFSYVGAAIATLVSYLLLLALGLVVTEKIIKYNKKALLWQFSKILFCCLLMATLVLFLKIYLHFIIVIPLAILFYFVLLYLLRGFERADLDQLKQILKKTN